MSLNYTHEVMYVTPGQEEPYMTCVLALMTKPGFASEEVPDPQLGLWRTAEVSGEWPKVINLWESKSWQEKANSFKWQFTDAPRDPFFEEWWNRNLTLRSGGFDRQLIPTDYSPDIARLRGEGVKGRVFLHEMIRVPLGEAPRYLARVAQEFLPAAKKRGWQLVGAFSVALRPREVLTIWAMREWRELTDLLAARDAPDLREWFGYRDRVVTCSEEMVLLPGRVNPLGVKD